MNRGQVLITHDNESDLGVNYIMTVQDIEFILLDKFRVISCSRRSWKMVQWRDVVTWRYVTSPLCLQARPGYFTPLVC